MNRSFAPFVLCLLLALLVAAPASPGADQQPKELWDEFPLEQRPPEPTPTPQGPQATPGPASAPESDGGGGLSSTSLALLLVGAAALGGVAVLTAGRRLRGGTPAPAEARAARTGRFKRRAEPPAAVAANGQARESRARRRAEPPPETEPTPEAAPHPVDEARSEPVAKRAPHPFARPAPEPVAEPAPEPVAESAPLAESAPEPVAESAPEPVAEPVPEARPEPVPEARPEPVAEPAPEPVADSPPDVGPTEAEADVAAAPEPARDPAPAARESAARGKPRSRRKGGGRRQQGTPSETPAEPAPRNDEPPRAPVRATPPPAARPIAPPPLEPAEPPHELVRAAGEAYPSCRIKLHNRPIRAHFYAIPYEGGPVLARSPYFKLQRNDDHPGPTAPEALRALVEELHALGWQQTGVGSAPWDLRFQRGVPVAPRRG